MENTNNTHDKEKNESENMNADTTKDLSGNNTEQKKESESKESNKTFSRKKKSSGSAELEKMLKENEDLRYKISEINDRYLRLSAEFDNYRKRTLKERTDLLKTAGSESLTSMLPILDDFERAIQSMNSASDISAVRVGIDLIYNKMREFIKSKGIVEIDALNNDFDTDFHEALTKIPVTDESKKGKVVDVIEKGYKIEDKVIRFAKVVVGE